MTPSLCPRVLVSSLLTLLSALNRGLTLRQLETLQLPLLRGDPQIGDSYSILMLRLVKQLRCDATFPRLLNLLLPALRKECGQTRQIIVPDYYGPGAVLPAWTVLGTTVWPKAATTGLPPTLTPSAVYSSKTGEPYLYRRIVPARWKTNTNWYTCPYDRIWKICSWLHLTL